MGINMIQSLSITSVFCFAALALASSVHGNPLMNIVELASNDPDLSTFVTALKASGASKDINLIATLSSPLFAFTVFAPTNKAFSLIPKATLAHLLDPANVNELVDILKYHVLSTPIQSKELKNMTHEMGNQGSQFQGDVESLEGEYLIVQNFVDPDPTDRPFNEVIVNDALLTFTDLQASNGVVHIIDHVLLPTYVSDLSIMEIISSKPELSTFATALKAGLLTGALEGNGRLQRSAEFDVWEKFVFQCAYGNLLIGDNAQSSNVPSNGAQCPFTVVAPSNEAFAKLPQATLDHLLDPKNVVELQKILEFHIIPGLSLIAGRADNEFCLQGAYSTLTGSTNLAANTYDNGTTILSPNGNYYNEPKPAVKETTSLVIQANLGASNGIVHVIDTVLIPRAPTRTIMAGLVDNIDSRMQTGAIVNALHKGLLDRSLNDPVTGPYTFFAPTIDAFNKIPSLTLAFLLDPKNIGELQNILEYHIIPGVAMRTGCRMSGRTCGPNDVEANGFIKTLAGKDVTITTKGEVGVDAQVMIDKATVMPFLGSYCQGRGAADDISNNGNWVSIDTVLMPALVSTL